MVDDGRRKFLYYGLGSTLLAVTGCGKMVRSDELPGAPWPDIAARPDAVRVVSGSIKEPAAVEIGKVIGRSAWTKQRPIMSRINRMNGVRRITIHHEGGEPVYFTDVASTARRLLVLRRGHIGRGWADIGYHYVIDRAGRVWEGRPIWYQGAHVRDNNEHNAGVMLLGNFDRQEPSEAQLRALQGFVVKLSRKYHVASNRIYTHRELMETACPGRMLQPRVVAMRRMGQLV